MEIFRDARDDLEGLDDPIPLEPSPPASPVRQGQEAVPPEEVAAVPNRDVAPPNRPTRRENRSRSRSTSPRQNPHENSKYILVS